MSKFNLKDYSYDLPKDLIAKYPSSKREDSRLLILDRKSKTITEGVFHQISNFLSPNDVVVRNISKVIPARIYGIRAATGGKVEILVLKLPQDNCPMPALIKTRGHIKKDEFILLPGNKRALYCGKEEFHRIEFCFDNVLKYMEKYGQMPLPPYIKRESEVLDRDRYQTVYAKNLGSIAAPTAGLHFSSEFIRVLENEGVEFVDVNLDVSYGTFKPLSESDAESGRLHKEYFSLSPGAAESINRAKKENKRIVAVGTTTVRVLESQAYIEGQGARVKEGKGETDLFIYPPYKFRIVDALITNFHLPRSSLLFLASAFCGKDFLFSAYQHAVKAEYRFFSYGDCMFIQ